MNNIPSELQQYNFWHKLVELAFVSQIILFGSRAKGCHSKRSDIDIAVQCDNFSMDKWLTINQIIEEADTLLKIDCISLDKLSQDDALRSNILQGIVIYKKKEGYEYSR